VLGRCAQGRTNIRKFERSNNKMKTPLTWLIDNMPNIGELPDEKKKVIQDLFLKAKEMERIYYQTMYNRAYTDASNGLYFGFEHYAKGGDDAK
jgi:hypothetical protein